MRCLKAPRRGGDAAWTADTVAARLSLKPEHGGGVVARWRDADAGAGMDVGAGLVVPTSSSGLSVHVGVRPLLVH